MVSESTCNNHETIFLKGHLQKLQTRYENKCHEVALLYDEIVDLKNTISFMEKALSKFHSHPK